MCFEKMLWGTSEIINARAFIVYTNVLSTL